MKFIRPKATADRVGYHVKHLPKIDGFPRRVRLGPRSVAYIESEIEEWMRARKAERDQEDADEA